jgi:hypothetical protein
MRPPEVTLADRLALAILTDGPAPGSMLALRAGVRKQAALRELRTNPRFVAPDRRPRPRRGDNLEARGARKPAGDDARLRR